MVVGYFWGAETYFYANLVPKSGCSAPGSHAQSLHTDELHNTIYPLSLDC